MEKKTKTSKQKSHTYIPRKVQKSSGKKTECQNGACINCITTHLTLPYQGSLFFLWDKPVYCIFRRADSWWRSSSSGQKSASQPSAKRPREASSSPPAGIPFHILTEAPGEEEPGDCHTEAFIHAPAQR